MKDILLLLIVIVCLILGFIAGYCYKCIQEKERMYKESDK